MKPAFFAIFAAVLLCGESASLAKQSPNARQSPNSPRVDIAALHARAARGSVRAQNDLGFMYAAGRGVRKNHAEAVRWFRMAAERGNALAQNNLGFAYAQGEGVRKDDAEAVRWYRKGAGQGSAPAQNGLGFMYAVGRGVERNYVEAGKWFLLAGRQRQESAERNYARLQRFLTPAEREDVERMARVFRPEAGRDKRLKAAPRSARR